MIRHIPPFYTAIPVFASFVAVVGVVSDQPTIAYLVPAIFSGILAVLAGWDFVRDKKNLSFIVLYSGNFLFFHFQLCLPEYWEEFVGSISEYSEQARLFSVISANLLPTAGVWIMSLLEKWRPLKPVEVNNGPKAKCRYNERLIFAGFIGVYCLVSVPNVFFGGVIRSSVDAILYMRGTTSATGGVLIDSQISSLLNINHFACSLVMLSLALVRSRYRWIIFVLMPFSVIWAVASVFAMGNRTQVLQFGVFFIVPLLGSSTLKAKSVIAACGACGLLFVSAQVMSFYRNVGLKEVRVGELFSKISAVQGLETMHDQTRSMEMFLEGYRNPNGFGFAPIDFLYGMIYRPIELLIFPLPRSVFPWKPEDPTGHDLNRWAIGRMGINPNEQEWGITAGLIGRDTLRWGLLGPVVALFWFSVLCWYADREYTRDRWSFNQRLIAGAFAGTALAMFRDLSPLWCLQLIPAAAIIMVSRLPISVSKVKRALTRARRGGRLVWRGAP